MEDKVLENRQDEVKNWTEAASEWDVVPTVIPAGSVGHENGGGTTFLPKDLNSSCLNYGTAIAYMRIQDYSHLGNKIQPSVPRSRLRKLLCYLNGPPKLSPNLKEEREFVFAVAHTALDNEQATHINILLTIYRLLTGDKITCPRYGSHWEQIGFQGQDPATDLRGTGMFGLLQPLSFICNQQTLPLMKQFYKLSLDETQNFPFMVLSINITGMVLKLLREDKLNKLCNRRSQVLSVCNNMYGALLLHLYNVWKKGKKTIENCGNVLRDAEKIAAKKPSVLLKNLNTYLEQNKINERSVNVVTDTSALEEHTSWTDIGAAENTASKGNDIIVNHGERYQV